MPTIGPGLSNPLLQRIISLLPPEESIYLVGGAVRDALLQRSCYDFDFVMAGDALKIARQVANSLGAAYFPLDTERNVARLFLRNPDEFNLANKNPVKLDFSSFQAEDLLNDLRGRDFTINAMAIDIHHPDTLIDPLGGAEDLVAKQLRVCSPTSLQDDPVRILRAVRQAVDLELKILPETLQLMRDATVRLPLVSPERVRDEIFRILSTSRQAISIRLLEMVGALNYILPELSELKGVQQSPPHTLDAWDHTLDLLKRLETLLDILSVEYDSDKASNLSLGSVVLRLGRFRQFLTEHLSSSLNLDRPHRGLLFLAGLYHDVGKPETQSQDEGGKIRFINHDQVGMQLIEKRGEALRLSKNEIERLTTIVGHHMRPSLLSHEYNQPSKKAVYRFFRDTGAAGIDICLLSVADMQATYGASLSQDRWMRHLDVVRLLMEAWWETPAESILPPSLVNGHDLMASLGLSPGPIVGYLLETIREAQVSGKILNYEQAINLAQEMLANNLDKEKVD